MATSKHRKNHKQKLKARKISAENKKKHIINLNTQLQEILSKTDQSHTYNVTPTSLSPKML